MTQPSTIFGETWRVLAYTLAIALAFIALEQAQLAVFSLPSTTQLLRRAGLLDATAQAALQQQAAQVAEASGEALLRLPPGHRTAALRLGYELVYANYLVAGYAMAPPSIKASARQRVAPRLAAARGHAAGFGLGEFDLLPADTLKQFSEVCQRYEVDENGLAARIEQQASPLHRHFYLLGAQLGCEAARVDDSGGRFALPPATPIRRHAVLAGIDEALWQPLIAEPGDETPAQVQQRYRRAIDMLMVEVARQDAADATAPISGPGAKDPR